MVLINILNKLGLSWATGPPSQILTNVDTALLVRYSCHLHHYCVQGGLINWGRAVDWGLVRTLLLNFRGSTDGPRAGV